MTVTQDALPLTFASSDLIVVRRAAVGRRFHRYVWVCSLLFVTVTAVGLTFRHRNAGSGGCGEGLGIGCDPTGDLSFQIGTLLLYVFVLLPFLVGGTLVTAVQISGGWRWWQRFLAAVTAVALLAVETVGLPLLMATVTPSSSSSSGSGSATLAGVLLVAALVPSFSVTVIRGALGWTRTPAHLNVDRRTDTPVEVDAPSTDQAGPHS